MLFRSHMKPLMKTQPLENVLVTSGAKDAISLCCRALMDDDSVIFVPSPTYLTAIPIFRRTGAHIVSVKQDQEGLCPARLSALMKTYGSNSRRSFVYLIPEFDNPTGRSLSLARRQEIARVIAHYGAVLIEDDPYRQIRFSGDAYPAVGSDRKSVV